jgi:hypothetical protein
VHLPEDATDGVGTTVDADHGETCGGLGADWTAVGLATTATLVRGVGDEDALLEVGDEPLTEFRKGGETMLDYGHR